MNFILLFLCIIIIWATTWKNLLMPYTTTKAQISLRIRAVWSAPLLLFNISSFYIRNFKPLTSFSVAAQTGLSLTQYDNNRQLSQWHFHLAPVSQKVVQKKTKKKNSHFHQGALRKFVLENTISVISYLLDIHSIFTCSIYLFIYTIFKEGTQLAKG